MTNSEILDNLSEKDDRNPAFIDFDKQSEWKNCTFDFSNEYEQHFSLRDEEETENVEIDEQDDTDERSSVTIVTPEEIEIEISDKSEESSIHFCFREIDISDSQLKIRNVYNLYSVPNDPGIVDAFWSAHSQSKVYSEDFQKFNDIAKVMKLRPISCLKDMFRTTEINLGYYGFDPRIFKAICHVLVENNTVEILELRDNFLSLDACYHLNELLLKNTILTSIILSGCRIGAQGAKLIEEGLSSAPVLQNLNLSHCELGNEGFYHISTGVYLSEVLKTLDLSDNHLSKGSAKSLGTMILKSETLAEINLSWNSLNDEESCNHIFSALKHGRNLEKVNLSWNALGSVCTSYLCNFLSKPSNIKTLNLNGNRFNDIDAQEIAKVLSKNYNLQEFHIGNNPLKAAGASELIQSLTFGKAPASRIYFLDLENIWVKKNVLAILQNIENTKPWLNIKLGGILGNFKLVGPNEKKIFLKRANFEAMNTKKKKERKEFGHFILSLENGLISTDKFAELVKTFKLKLSDTLIKAIAKAFSIGKNLVDQRELKAFYLKEYPDTQLPPEKEKKIKKDKKKATKIRREKETKKT
ncbi:leucine-rich repeat-containing protein 74B-like isoform X2 [Belonocnema kinseyi]|uniref:leucine-rich repeat-containing protein 74B-like isoform X2 n=1 Tax=Belonocnema kinseyi TaxID=2817044 RepID=UPI00143D5FA1|nr:leucine-rich repeat-containing protein 74B-like isoform X2 [Belonocnema kinseyi]